MFNRLMFKNTEYFRSVFYRYLMFLFYISTKSMFLYIAFIILYVFLNKEKIVCLKLKKTHIYIFLELMKINEWKTEKRSLDNIAQLKNILLKKLVQKEEKLFFNLINKNKIEKTMKCVRQYRNQDPI